MRDVVFVKDVSEKFRGEARLYRVLGSNEYVVASSAFGAYVNETMVFPADETGSMLDSLELGVAYPAGEFREALHDAGFRLVAG